MCEGTRTVSLSYVQGGTNTHIAPATGVRTEVVTSRSGSAHQTLRFDENGTTVLEAGSSEDNSAAPQSSGGLGKPFEALLPNPIKGH